MDPARRPEDKGHLPTEVPGGCGYSVSGSHFTPSAIPLLSGPEADGPQRAGRPLRQAAPAAGSQQGEEVRPRPATALPAVTGVPAELGTTGQVHTFPAPSQTDQGDGTSPIHLHPRAPQPPDFPGTLLA